MEIPNKLGKSTSKSLKLKLKHNAETLGKSKKLVLNKCKNCQNLFKLQSDLTLHEVSCFKVSTCAFLYKCSLCRKIFPDSYLLGIHVRKIHKSKSAIGIKLQRIKCRFCKKT